MSSFVVGILGLITIIAIVATLFRSKTQPAVAFIVFPALLGLALVIAVCRNCATFISPMVPATLLGTGLAEVDVRDHFRASFPYVWAFSALCMIFAVIAGIMPL